MPHCLPVAVQECWEPNATGETECRIVQCPLTETIYPILSAFTSGKPIYFAKSGTNLAYPLLAWKRS